jgi:hypothetical protein
MPNADLRSETLWNVLAPKPFRTAQRILAKNRPTREKAIFFLTGAVATDWQSSDRCLTTGGDEA